MTDDDVEAHIREQFPAVDLEPNPDEFPSRADLVDAAMQTHEALAYVAASGAMEAHDARGWLAVAGRALRLATRSAWRSFHRRLSPTGERATATGSTVTRSDVQDALTARYVELIREYRRLPEPDERMGAVMPLLETLYEQGDLRRDPAEYLALLEGGR